MPLLLRKISYHRWLQPPQPSLPTLASLQADAFIDLRTQGNRLSVWFIEDNRLNLSQVLTALAANCDDSTNVDYALIDQKLVLGINIKIESTKGLTPCLKANNWHRELIELTAEQLVEIAEIIVRYGVKERISEKNAFYLVSEAVNSGIVDLAKLKEKLKAKVENIK